MRALSCIIPCYGRPQRTLRALDSVVAQTFKARWEAIFIGDGCPFFQQNIDDGVFQDYSNRFPGKLIFKNLEKNYGGFGAIARKEGIDTAEGKYICFLDNDDVLLPNHFENYYMFMKANPDIDVGYFNSYIDPWKRERKTYLGPDAVGHSEIIVKAEILKKEYIPNYEYGHDWTLIDSLIKKGYTHSKCRNPPTYIIKGLGDSRETSID